VLKFWVLLRAEIKRYYAISWSVPGDSLVWFLYTILIFIAAIIILNGIKGGGFGSEDQLLVMVGWMTWIVASDCMAEMPDTIVEETQTGTLEQICIVPVKLSTILAVRSLAFLFGSGIKGILAIILLGFFVTPLPITVGLILLFFISLMGAYGMGFIFAGLALVFKRISALTGLVFSLMIFLTGSLVSLDKLGWVYDLLHYLFPLTWGISLMRGLLSESLSFTNLVISGELTGITIHSVIYFSVGLAILSWGYHIARTKGTLAHY
jgi:ABC-2 type transport system permease protein